MKISGYDLYSSTSNSIGLFKEIKQTNQKNSFINNLILEPGYIRASNVSQVGCLAGVIDSGYIYNIRIDADSLVVLGKNAVGGLAGVIKGEFIINGIESNVGANATFRSAGSKINIYTGKFNTGSSMSNNLSSVSYAGAIAGIVEGYDNRFSSEVYLDNYYKISNCYVYGLIYIGETVGGAFGYVGERAMVSNITFEASSSTFLKAVYYSGGIVGENRGIVANSVSKSSTITYGIYDASLVDSSILSSFAIVNGGIVAVNYGGLIYNCTNENAVVSKYHLATVGGICGRNSYGTLVKVKNTGLVYGLFAGGITGSDYTRFTLTNTGNATGSVSDGTKYALPSKIIDYSKIKLDNTTISSSVQYQNIQNLDNWFEKQYRDLDNISKSLSNFYSYTLGNTADETSYNYKQVLGSIIAITDAIAYNYNVLTSNLALQYNADKAENESVIENKNSNILKCGNDLNNHLYQNGNDIKFYYFVSVLNATYDFWNLSNGYNGAFVKIVD